MKYKPMWATIRGTPGVYAIYALPRLGSQLKEY